MGAFPFRAARVPELKDPWQVAFSQAFCLRLLHGRLEMAGGACQGKQGTHSSLVDFEAKPTARQGVFLVCFP